MGNVEQRLARPRVKEIELTLADIDRCNQTIQQAEAANEGLQSPEFSRYERHITRQLYEALDRLSAIIDQRNLLDFVGSFGQIDLRGMSAEQSPL